MCFIFIVYICATTLYHFSIYVIILHYTKVGKTRKSEKRWRFTDGDTEEKNN
jgi:hypothetical protein